MPSQILWACCCHVDPRSRSTHCSFTEIGMYLACTPQGDHPIPAKSLGVDTLDAFFLHLKNLSTACTCIVFVLDQVCCNSWIKLNPLLTCDICSAITSFLPEHGRIQNTVHSGAEDGGWSWWAGSLGIAWKHTVSLHRRTFLCLPSQPKHARNLWGPHALHCWFNRVNWIYNHLLQPIFTANLIM